MARPGELLRRFRLLAVPGAAGLSGVPADASAQRRDELAPVLAELAGAIADAEGEVERAQEEAKEIIARADDDCAAAAERAQADAPRVRAEAATATSAAARAEADRLGDDAARDARSISERGEPTARALAREVADAVLALAKAGST